MSKSKVYLISCRRYPDGTRIWVERNNGKVHRYDNVTPDSLRRLQRALDSLYLRGRLNVYPATVPDPGWSLIIRDKGDGYEESWG